MTKKVNKDITSSEELFRKLETNDSSGLDDFEKEAFEGFTSLENPDLAREMNKKLNKQIEAQYFKKEKNTTLLYLGMAAGLALIIGLSVFFYNYISDKKETLAMQKELKEKEDIIAKDLELAPPAETQDPSEEPALSEKSNVTNAAAVEDENKTSASGAKRNEQGMTARAVLGPVTKKSEQPADTRSDNETVKDHLANAEGSVNSPVNTAAPVVTEEQKAPAKEADAKTESYTWTTTSASRDEKAAKPSANLDYSKNDELSKKRQVENRKGKDKDQSLKSEREGELAQEAPSRTNVSNESKPQVMAAQNNNNVQTTASQGAGTPADDNSGYYKSAQYTDNNFTKAKEYIKTELDKNELLQKNVRSFKAKLTLNGDGKITKVKFLSSFKDCAGCEKALENILLDMPKWTTEKSGKKTTEVLEFTYP